MEFKDMQVIWDNQNNEKLYAINEEALHEQIKQKGRTMAQILNKFEFIMIGVNLFVTVWLFYDGITDGDPWVDYILPVAYLFYTVVMIWRRTQRKAEEIHFAPTMIGDLEKAIWQANYLIKQSKDMIGWYLVPLMLLVTIFTFFNRGFWFAVGFMVLVVPATYFASKWEINKFYAPKLRDLEALKETLLDS
ncbi:MAG: hypothetical protein AAF490_19195 [Chloroflexota bacterium]